MDEFLVIMTIDHSPFLPRDDRSAVRTEDYYFDHYVIEYFDDGRGHSQAGSYRRRPLDFLLFHEVKDKGYIYLVNDAEHKLTDEGEAAYKEVLNKRLKALKEAQEKSAIVEHISEIKT